MKHSKLFLTGMAALLLSFGLMMTGCDSGGDSDSGDDPINAGEYISIVETTPGITADDSVIPPVAAQAAVYTVTVKQSLANKVVTFTNVATDPVVYGPPAEAVNTAALQAAAIVTKLTAADGANYDVAYTAGAESFTLTAKTAGAIANAPAVAIDNYTPPPVKTSEAFTVTAGDNALKITGAANATGTFDESAKVYIKTGGKEVLITDETSAPTGYTAPGGTVVLIADTESNKPVLWVKGLAAAVTSATDGKILASTAGATDVKVVITGGAQTGNVGDITAVVSGTAVVIPANGGTAYALAADATGANTIFFTAASGDDPATVDWQDSNSGSAVGDTNLDPIFDAALIAVLTVLEATDEITVDAKGIITGAEIVATTPDAAKINAVLGVHDNVTLGADATLDDDVTVPAGKTLTVAASTTLTVATTKTLTVTGAIDLGAGAVIDASAVSSSVVVGSGGNTVTIDLATVRATAAEPKFADGATGVVTLSDTNDITFVTAGKIVVAGTGKVELANTTLGAGTYTSTGATVITSGAAGDTIVTGGSAGNGLAMTGGVSLINGSGAIATYTLTAGTGTGNKVVFNGATVTVPADSTAGASIAGGATTSIVLGSGSIKLGGNSAEAKRGSLGLYTGAKIGVFASGNTSNTTLTNLGGNTALATGTNDAVAIATGITVTIGGSTATTKVVSGSDGNDGTIAAGNAVGSS